MPKEYLTYVRKYADLQNGVRNLFIKDLTPGPRKYDTKQVKAMIARSSADLPEGDILWVRSEMGVLDPDPWSIKILEDLPDYVEGRPYSDIFLALGW
ncbi:MAG: hypothetical protein VR68_06730 [Peptococcaceae bacterium BRH_c4a]|nr:MAG: hypothetical protein VR68_06730 [Peptococcaceae bacterium BRH_c4a]